MVEPKTKLTPYEVLVKMNCWEYCHKCKGWGIIFLKAGIPNITEPCSVCGGGGIVWK